MGVYYWASYLATLLSCGRRRKAPKTSAPFHDSSGLKGSFNLHDERSTGPITTTDYAHRCRALMGLYKNLCNLGVHATSFDLPRVVVIGSQSSGKSSLVEAVSGIKVPRDSGTCTRCPMECTMSSDAESWSCCIEIRREYDDNDSRLRCPTVDRFGPVIDRKAKVELWIRRAQAAVLSASQNYSDFYNMSADDLRALPASHRRFSRNIIHITIKDPEATDLSFVDLPGLITNDDLMDTVRSMVEEHIMGPSTLIVIAMPMTDDYQNMQAVRLAKQTNVDPDGNRTIGVLTKPDVLKPGDIGALSSWSEVIKGNKYQTKHGYYCVCLHDDEDRARGLSQQREEEIFFNSEPPWNQLDQTRFGVPNFVRFVSTLLVQQIDKSVPDLRRRIKTELSRCKHELAELPLVNTDDPWTVIMLHVTKFCVGLKETISGEKKESFVQSNRKFYIEFKEDILETTPNFRPFEGEDLSESCQVPSCQMEPCPHHMRGLEHVRRIIQQCYTWELPKHAPYKFKASHTLIREYTSLWADPAHRCFDKVAENYTNCLRNLIQEHFGHYANLKGYVSHLITSERERCCKEANEMLDKILQMENDPVFTQNSDELNRQEIHWEEIYLQEMNRESRPGSIAPSESSHPPSPPSVSRASRGTEVPWRKEDEVGVMALVRSYFQVAHHRISDNVPLIIEHELNQNFSDRIHKILVGTITKDLRTGSIVPEDLLREDPNLATRRNYLEDRIFQLDRVGAQLDDPDSEPILRLGLDSD